MALSAADQQRIIDQESAWIDTSFSSLDLSQFPALAPVPPEEAHDDRFAKSWADSALSRSARDLRSFIENPDLAAMSQVATETGNPDYVEQVRDIRGELEATKFKRLREDYVQTDHNYRTIVEVLSYNFLSSSQQNCTIEQQMDALCAGGFWTAANLCAAYDALSAEGALDVAAGTARQLSSSEQLDVARLAQNGKLFEAIDKFLQYSLPDEEPTTDILTDPNYRDLLDTAVLHVWELSAEDYVPTAERRAFIQNYAAGRPLTLTLVSAGWAACKESESRYQRGELLEQYQRPQETAPPTQKELEAMDDDEVARLYRASLREYVRSIKAPGVLA